MYNVLRVVLLIMATFFLGNLCSGLVITSILDAYIDITGLERFLLIAMSILAFIVGITRDIVLKILEHGIYATCFILFLCQSMIFVLIINQDSFLVPELAIPMIMFCAIGSSLSAGVLVRALLSFGKEYTFGGLCSGVISGLFNIGWFHFAIGGNPMKELATVFIFCTFFLIVSITGLLRVQEKINQ